MEGICIVDSVEEVLVVVVGEDMGVGSVREVSVVGSIEGADSGVGVSVVVVGEGMVVSDGVVVGIGASLVVVTGEVGDISKGMASEVI